MESKIYACGLIVLLLSIGLTSVALAQTSWWRTYGGSEHDNGSSVSQTTDGGYIIAGTTYSFGAGTPDFGSLYLVKTDSSGDTLWTRTYGGPAPDYAASVQQTADSGYIIAGITESYGAGYWDVYLVKTNAAGDVLWIKTCGGSADDAGNSVRQTADGGYIVAGWTYSFGPGTPTSGNFYLIKTNAQGDTLWTRTYGGTNHDGASCVQQAADGGYLLAGSTWSFGADSGDAYLVRTDAHGDTLWTRRFGGVQYDGVTSVQATDDGGCIVAGHTCSFGVGTPDNDNVYLVRTDSAGDTLWTKVYGGPDFDAAYEAWKTADGGYAVVGPTGSYGAGDVDVYLVKTNGAGDTLWTRTYGGANGDWGFSLQQANDGGYVITGSTSSFGAGNEDVYLIKTDAEGNLGIVDEKPASPVPSHGLAASVVRNLPLGAKAFDAMGRRVLDAKPGIYFLRTPTDVAPRKVLLVE